MTTPAKSQSIPSVANAATRPWVRAAWISGLFCCFLALVMTVGHIGTKAEDPFKSPRLKQLKDELRANPLDDQIKQKIRQLDLEVRKTYFHQMSRMQLGVYLLLGGTGVCILVLRRKVRIERGLPMPGAKPDPDERRAVEASRARWAVAASGAAMVCLLLVLALGPGTPVSLNSGQFTANAEPGAAAGPDAASLEDSKLNWPAFRGVQGSGWSPLTNVPTEWDPKTGKGVLWKVPSPAPGFNSPIAWGDRVFFSGGDEKLREVFCLDGKTGQILWRQAVTNVPGAPARLPEIPETTGYAASTMATDGRRVYVIFATGDVAAFTLDGRQVWAKNFGALNNPYGHATSLATWEDRLLLQLDQGDGEDGKSKLLAVDGPSGKVLWQKPRRVGASWASPIALEAGGKAQVITLALPAVVSYSVADGAELWRAECLNGEVTPSPSYAGGPLFVASPSEMLMALRPDGSGDVTKTHILWQNEDSVPDVSSPASTSEFVFTVTTSGILTCLDAKDGKRIWEHDFEMEVHASPTVAGQHLYILGEEGATVVVETGQEYKEVFRVQMEDEFHATPAFAMDRIYLRGVTNIWGLGK